MVLDSELQASIWSSRAGRNGSTDPCAFTVFHEHGASPNHRALTARLRECHPSLGSAELAVVDTTNWAEDPYALGSYSLFGGTPATRAMLDAIQQHQPLNDAGAIALAGEYASDDPRVQGHLEGALRSGKRAAEHIYRRLRLPNE